ncbi:hypothetical protein LSAT2_031056 [Lamellibrachia satsuma]|nr:hypothetical protein LSAT2_031056 [Lamellibrachia satsuma]
MATSPSSMHPGYIQVTDSGYTASSPSQGFPLSYVDFIPALIKPGGILTSPKYERFVDLMIKANNWLQANPTIRVITCESLEVRAHEVNTDVSTSFDYQHLQSYLRSLRIWISSKTAADMAEPQQLGYLNVVPACKDAGGFLTMPTFDTFGETVDKLNAMLSTRPLPGRILNLETQDIKMYQWTGSVDPDESYWAETGKQVKTYLNIIRLFYEAAPPAYERIGCVDFVPACIQPWSLLKPFVFEPFSAVLLKAQAWIQQQPMLQVASVQSINYKIHTTWSSSVLDTQGTLFRELGKNITCYVRILRVCYISSTSQPRQPLTALACKTFVPCQLTQQGTFAPPTFETQSQTMRRALTWLQATGARVISSETVPLKKVTNFQFDPNVTLTVKSATTQQELYVLRVYLDGYYSEPPSEVLPPVSAIAPPVNIGCCTLL